MYFHLEIANISEHIGPVKFPKSPKQISHFLQVTEEKVIQKNKFIWILRIHTSFLIQVMHTQQFDKDVVILERYLKENPIKLSCVSFW